jgi:hypothetical protein
MLQQTGRCYWLETTQSVDICAWEDRLHQLHERDSQYLAPVSRHLRMGGQVTAGGSVSLA